MSVISKVIAVHLPQSMSEQERVTFLQENRFKTKFGYGKKVQTATDSNGVEYIIYNQKNPIKDLGEPVRQTQSNGAVFISQQQRFKPRPIRAKKVSLESSSDPTSDTTQSDQVLPKSTIEMPM